MFEPLPQGKSSFSPLKFNQRFNSVVKQNRCPHLSSPAIAARGFYYFTYFPLKHRPGFIMFRAAFYIVSFSFVYLVKFIILFLNYRVIEPLTVSSLQITKTKQKHDTYYNISGLWLNWYTLF